MKRRILKWLILLGWSLFFGAIPVLYLFPPISGHRAFGLILYFVGLLIVAPSLVWLMARACRRGLHIASDVPAAGPPIPRRK